MMQLKPLAACSDEAQAAAAAALIGFTAYLRKLRAPQSRQSTPRRKAVDLSSLPDVWTAEDIVRLFGYSPGSAQKWARAHGRMLRKYTQVTGYSGAFPALYCLAGRADDPPIPPLPEPLPSKRHPFPTTTAPTKQSLVIACIERGGAGTAKEIAERMGGGVTRELARIYLRELLEKDQVRIVGRKPLPHGGPPAPIYGLPGQAAPQGT